MQHDYDLVKRTHRRNLLASGISKASSRKRSAGGSRDGSFVRPISPAAMPDLIKEAESELEKSFNWGERFTTPVRTNLSVTSTSHSRWIDPGRLFDPIGPREWGKNDWKILDACFTDERLDAGEKMGMSEGSLADVTDIRLDDVVNRFVEVIGGDAVLATVGPSWTRFVVFFHFERRLIGFVTQEGHLETSSCVGEEAKSGKGCTRDTSSISDTILGDVGTYRGPRLHTYWTPTGCKPIGRREFQVARNVTGAAILASHGRSRCY